MHERNAAWTAGSYKSSKIEEKTTSYTMQLKANEKWTL